MRKLIVLFSAGCFGCLAVSAATAQKEVKLTQVVNDVEIISAGSETGRTVAADALLKATETLRTGSASRVELKTEDGVITRAGAKTIFSFDAANHHLHLEQGSLLVDASKGKSETIHAGTASISVRGGTVVVSDAKDGGSKVLALTGTVDVQLPRGAHQRLGAGEMMFVGPDGMPGTVSTFRLDDAVTGGKLISGFDQALPSLLQINVQIARQLRLIQSGQAAEMTNGVPVINPIAEINGGLDRVAGIGPRFPRGVAGVPGPLPLPPLPPQPIAVITGAGSPSPTGPRTIPTLIESGGVIVTMPPPVPITIEPIIPIPPINPDPITIISPPIIPVIPPPVLITSPIIVPVSPPVPPPAPPPTGVVIIRAGGSLGVSAHTIVLGNIALPPSGQTTFITGNGLLAPNPNTGSPVIPGDLNFTHNVTYQGRLAAPLGGSGFTIGKP